MVKSHIKFSLIDNEMFHKRLETVSESVLHHITMSRVINILDGIVDASISIFGNLPQTSNGKCYYPLFLREPFSLKGVDFCKFMESQHLKLMQEGRVIPLICMLSESWELFNFQPDRIFRNSAYFNVIDTLEKNGIKEQNVVWLTCDKYHRTDFRIKAKFLHFDYFLEQQKVLSNPFTKIESIKHKFISMAQGVHRHHRYAMTYKLYEENLLQHGLVSCPEYENFSYVSTPETTDQYMKKLQGFDPGAFEQWKRCLPYNIDGKQNLHQTGQDESSLFKEVFLLVCNETHQPDDTVFLTEKTYRAINYCRPFVVNGDTGSLGYLQELGFKTFNEFWDESYDTETSDHARIVKIIGIIKNICAMTNDELLALYHAIRPVLEYNYNVLKNYEQWNKLN